MVSNKSNIFLVFLTIILAQNPIDLYINSSHNHELIGTIEDGVEKPRDLDFHPIINNQLWVLNQGEDAYQNNSQIITSHCLPVNMNLIFTIYDSDDDGICCDSGEGSYLVSDCNNIYASGGEYESSESTSFFIESSCPNSCAENESSIEVIINTDDWAKEISWQLTDFSESIIYAKKLEPGGSTVIYSDAGESNQTSEYRKDSYSRHFMNTASALAFDNQGFFANTLECKDANNNINGFFSGPTLWDSNLSQYAIINQNGPLLGSHLDMIHQSPFSMGIDYAGTGNVYWVFDGYHSSIVRYDFSNPHEPGGHDHSDGKVWRYDDIEINMHDGVSSHLVFDDNTGLLYIADTGNQRILIFDTFSGNYLEELNPYGESLEQYWLMENASWDIYIEQGLLKPSGIDFYNNRLVVSDYESGYIHIYDTSSDSPQEIGVIDTGYQNSIMGVKIGPDRKIWYVNHSENSVHRIDHNMIIGDINVDETLNVLDVVGLVSYLTNNINFNNQQMILADLNFDNELNVLDVVTLVNIIIDLD